ncbi:MAG: ABC transporter permease [Saprospiraceae bacterium]|nr:ABC transporter permease [Saprospiraceae bacterium]
MFSFPFVTGNAHQALANPNSIVLTETTAKKYFGDTNPIGKMLILNQQYPLQVTGVLYDLPPQSHLQFDFVIPFEFIKNYGANFDDWGGNGYYTYVQLKDAARQSAIDSKLAVYPKNNLGWDGMKLYLQPLSDIHLKSAFDFNTDFGERGDIRYVRFFIILALVVLLLGCLNFMNLSTARALKRAKEVGLRKTIGAKRRHLVTQFLGESLLIVIIARLLSLVFVKLSMPAFSNFIEKPISFQFNNIQFWLIFSAIILATALFAGSYPAFVLSSYRPIKVLRGQNVATTSGINLRKALVVTQFTLAIIMSVAVLVIYQQLHFISNKKLGINKDSIVYVEMKGGLQKNYNIIKETLLQYPAIESVTATNFYSMPFKWVGSSGIRRLRIDGKHPGKELNLSSFDTDFDFIETMGIEMAAGRSFSKEFITDTANYILNEEAVRQLDIKDPIGKTFDYGVKGTIVGVVKDFHFSKLKDKIEPAILKIRPAETNYLLARIKSDNINNTIQTITKLSNQYSEGYPVEIHFLEADYEQLYQQERTTETLFGGFTALAIFISCLGLFGLVTHTAETRTKEIGIRKVLGANSVQIVAILSQDFYA